MSPNLSIDFSYALGRPKATALFRSELDDFIVNENLGFEPSGEGEHLYVHILKRGENTSWVAEKLAKYFSVKVMDVGYCGKKDRHAETSQWYSIYLPHGNELNVDEFLAQSELNAEVLAVSRHAKKLRRGEHQSNSFKIRLRDVSDIADVQQRLEKVAVSHVPNYFGEQRFGRDAGNLDLAQRWVEHGETIRNRNKRGLVMSAARSILFNRVLEHRVNHNTWCQCVEGDVDVNGVPSGPMWGRGKSPTTLRAKEIEDEALQGFDAWKDTLEHVGLQQERRPLVLVIKNFEYHFSGSELTLSLTLGAGEFATAVLREICLLVPANLVPANIRSDNQAG